MPDDIQPNVRSSALNRSITEFFTNSIHFPLANIFLELLLEGPAGRS